RAAAAAAPPPQDEAELTAELQEEAAPEAEPAAETERLVERNANASALAHYDDIRAAARERLFLDRNYADFLTRPLEQLIGDLCRDLGLTAGHLQRARRRAREGIRPPGAP